MSENKSKTLIERFGFKDKDLTTPEHDKMLLWVLNKENLLSMLKSLDLIKPKLHTQTLWHQNPCDASWTEESCSCSGICKKKDYYSNGYSFLSKEEKEDKLRENAEEIKKASEELLRIYNLFIEYTKSMKRADFLSIEIEHAILGYNNYNIGFIDAKVTVNGDYSITSPYCRFSYTPFDKDEDKPNKEYYIEIKPEVKSIGELIRQINLYRSHVKGGDWIVITKTKGLKETLKSQNIFVYEWTEVGETNQ